MLVNGKTLEQFNAKYLGVDFDTSTVLTYEDWLRNSHSPLYYGQQVTYSKCSIRVLIEGNTSGEVELNRSRLLGELLSATLEFDDFNFVGKLEKDSKKSINARACELEIDLKGIKENKDFESVFPSATYTPTEFNINGSADCNARFMFTITQDISILIMRLNDEEYAIHNLKAGHTYILDSIDGYLIDGTTGEDYMQWYNAWKLPYLKGGVNKLSFDITSVSGVEVQIMYKGRWI